MTRTTITAAVTFCASVVKWLTIDEDDIATFVTLCTFTARTAMIAMTIFTAIAVFVHLFTGLTEDATAIFFRLLTAGACYHLIVSEHGCTVIWWVWPRHIRYLFLMGREPYISYKQP
jgi:hypothetical protein